MMNAFFFFFCRVSDAPNIDCKEIVNRVPLDVGDTVYKYSLEAGLNGKQLLTSPTDFSFIKFILI